MGRREELQRQYEQQRQQQKADSSASRASGRPVAGRRPSRRGRKGLLWVVILLVVLGAAWLLGIVRCGPASGPVRVTGVGTGFFISPDGWLVTAAHVVEAADQVEVVVRGESVPARVVRLDRANDAALLKVEGQGFPVLPVGNSEELSLGDAVFTIGFPLPDIQGQSPKLTRGNISSLAGIQDDPRHFQISVAVQPGNSGGPLCGEDGIVRGLIVSRINDRFVLQSSGVVPQNINYALKSSYLTALLSPEPGAEVLSAARRAPAVGTAAARVEAATVLVVCFSIQP